MAGPRQRPQTGLVLPVFVNAALRGEPLVVHDDGEQRRAFLHVADAAEGLLLVMQSRSLQGRPVNLGGSEAVQIGKLARMVVEAAKTSAPIVTKPSNAVYGDRFAATYDCVSGYRPIDHRDGMACAAKHQADDHRLHRAYAHRTSNGLTLGPLVTLIGALLIAVPCVWLFARLAKRIGAVSKVKGDRWHIG